MIAFNVDNVNDIKIGETQITKVYVGESLIWENSSKQIVTEENTDETI